MKLRAIFFTLVLVLSFFVGVGHKADAQMVCVGTPPANPRMTLSWPETLPDFGNGKGYPITTYIYITSPVNFYLNQISYFASPPPSSLTYTDTSNPPSYYGQNLQYYVYSLDNPNSEPTGQWYYSGNATCDSSISVNQVNGTGSWSISSSPAGESSSSSPMSIRPPTSGATYTISVTAPVGSDVASITNSKSGSCGLNCSSLGMSMSPGPGASFTIAYQPEPGPNPSLSVSKTGTGTGTVTATGINCGSDCSEQYVGGTNVSLTATPTDSSNSFTGWSGDCSGATSPFNILMNANKSCTAQFTLIGPPLVYNTLTVSKSGTGSGVVTSNISGINCGSDCSESYLDGTSVTLSQTTTTGTFTGWSGAGCSGTGACSFDMSVPRTVTATYSGGGGGPTANIFVKPAGSGSYNTSVIVPSGSNIDIQWTSSGGLTRCYTNNNGGFSSAIGYQSPTGTFTNIGPVTGNFNVFVTCDTGNFTTQYSNQANVGATTAAPTGVIASPQSCGTNRIDVAWNPVSGASSYNVLRSTTSGSGYGTIVSGFSSSPFQNTGLTPGTTYYYVVQANGPGGTSANSNQASGTAPPLCPPDLTAGASVTVAPPTPVASANTTFSGMVFNASGAGNTGTTFQNFFQLSNSANGGTPLFTAISVHTAGPLPGTGTGSALTSSNYVFSPNQCTSGTCSIRLCVDNNMSMSGTIAESNEGNNCSPWVNFNLNTPSIADLTADPATPSTAFVNVPLTFNSNLRNIGTGSTVNPFSNYFQVNNGAGGAGGTTTNLTSASTAALAAGASRIITSPSHTFTGSGTYSVRMCADGTSPGFGAAIGEWSEANNCSSWTNVTVSSAPTAPTGVSAAAGACGTGTITISWNPVASATSYNVLRSTTSGSGYATFAGSTGLVGSPYANNSGLTAGTTYYYVVQAVNGAGASSNSAQSFAVAPAASCPSPNLTAAVPTPATATVGTALNFTSSISNTGTASTGASFSNFFQINNGAGGAGGTTTDLSSTSMAALANGTSATATSPAYTFSSAGTWSVRACADKTNAASAGVIAESSEADNCSSWTNVTVSAALIPNLTYGAITPTTATAGTPVTFSMTVTNNGTGGTGASFPNLFRRASGANGATPVSTLSEATIGPLAAGQSAQILSAPYTFPAAGTYSMRVLVDENAAFVHFITESNESDNTTPWTNVTVGAASQANLIAGNPTPITATAGTSTTITSSISNTGTASTGSSFTNLFQFDNDSDHSTVTASQTATGGPIANGASANVSTSYNFPTSGTWYFRACADSNASFVGTITESNEGDNCSGGAGWTSVTVSAALAPNLTAANVIPISTSTGTPTTVSSVITNNGNATTGSSFTNLFQFDNDSDHSTVTATQTATAGPIAASGTANPSVSYTFPTTGTWYVRACADNNASFVGTIAESNEGDNCSGGAGWTAVTVSPSAQPNLIILPAGDPTPTAATVSVATPFSATITNNGTATTGSSFTNLFQFDNDSNHATVTTNQTVTAGPIANGNTASPSSSYTFPATGTWYVRACADNNASFIGTITESSEGDNCSNWVIVTVSSANTPPIADAGPDKSITQPANTSAPTGTSATDPGGSVASTVWSIVPPSPGGSPAISSGNTLSPSFSGLTSAGVYTFRLTATDNLGLTDTDDMQVTVSAAASPVIHTFDATPPSINFGDSTTLNWTTSNATSCLLDDPSTPSDDPGASVGTSGPLIVTPLVTTQYRLTCIGNSQQTSFTISVTVGPVPAKKPIFYED